MKLLAVPLAIAAAGSIITGQIQREANQNTVLKAYFDKLEELTFERKLLAETPDEGAIVLARGRTVAALRELDLSRRTQLIAFLQASDLSQVEEGLAAPVISFKSQNLSSLDLREINLSGLDFREADLSHANLERANLKKANLEGTNLKNASLKWANLVSVNLKGADLWIANLEGAHLKEANLEGVAFLNVNLEGTYLESANLKGAYLWIANLEGAHLGSANLTSANLTGAENVTQEQIALAKLCRTILPGGITLDPNRDCEELGLDPQTGEPISP